MASAAFIALSPPAARPQRLRALGCRVWDAEGGEPRIDFDMAGGAALLGHAHPAVEARVATGAHAQTAAAALGALSPCAEAVRFTAEESHALPAAIAAARRETGKRRVLTATPALGMDCGADDIAAVVVDPLGASPADLAAARALADAAQAVLIFDEGVSAFRMHPMGAQGLGVIPDLAVYGAAIANGRSLGAVAGRSELIGALDEADLPAARSEALVAAAGALEFLAQAPIASQLHVLGAELQAEVARIIEAASAGRFFALEGDPTLPSPLFAAPQLEGLWLREMAARGFIVVGPHALCAAHGEAEIERLIDAYAHIVPAMVAKGMLETLLRRPPQPFAGFL